MMVCSVQTPPGSWSPWTWLCSTVTAFTLRQCGVQASFWTFPAFNSVGGVPGEPPCLVRVVRPAVRLCGWGLPRRAFPRTSWEIQLHFPTLLLGTFLPVDPLGGGIATSCVLGQQGGLSEGRGGRQEPKDRLVGPQPGCRARPCRPPAHGSRLTGERVSNLEDLRLNEYGECIRVHTDKGTEVATNLVIVCNGIRINSSAYHSAFGKQEPWPTPQGPPPLAGRCGPCRPLPRESASPCLPPPPAQQLRSLLNVDVKL